MKPNHSEPGQYLTQSALNDLMIDRIQREKRTQSRLTASRLQAIIRDPDPRKVLSQIKEYISELEMSSRH